MLRDWQENSKKRKKEGDERKWAREGQEGEEEHRERERERRCEEGDVGW